MRFLKLLYRVFFTLYALLGIFYFKWSIFPIIFLFWTENVIHLLFLVIIVNSFPHIKTPTDGTSIKGTVYLGLFFNFVYFVFLTFVWGFISLLMGAEGKKGFDVISSMVMVLSGRDMGFNIAAGLCVLRETWLYVRDFYVRKIYTAEYPFDLPKDTGYKEIVLHLSIILGLGGSLFLSKWFHPADSTTFLNTYGFITFFLVLKLTVEVFIFLRHKPKQSLT